MESLKKKFDAFTSFSQGEQAIAATSASDDTLQSLADWNVKYEEKFGHIFIICAAGKSADFMLEAVKTR
jgi:2-oxo-4-hydroxy-4-carboxy--5-ureidoimidazoline (OHCU) decarboxylase